MPDLVNELYALNKKAEKRVEKEKEEQRLRNKKLWLENEEKLAEEIIADLPSDLKKIAEQGRKEHQIIKFRDNMSTARMEKGAVAIVKSWCEDNSLEVEIRNESIDYGMGGARTGPCFYICW